MTAPTSSPPPAAPPSPPARRRRWPWFLGGAVVVALLLVVGGPFVYIHFIQADPPSKLTFENADSKATTTTAAGSSASTSSGSATTSATTAASGSASASANGSVDGTWTATTASQAGYRVKEVLFGQSAEAVGRTNGVTGQLTISGTTVSSGAFSVDMTSVKSDESRRDDQFNGHIMSTSQFPTATFKLTQPIDFGSLPADKTPITAKATGDLTLRGVTKSVTFDVSARRNGANIEVSGSIPILFADYSIPNPTTAGITTQDNGVVEFLLVFSKS